MANDPRPDGETFTPTEAPAAPPDDGALSPERITEITAALEAVLFAAGYPVPYAKLSLVIGLPESELRLLLSHMAEGYADRGIRLLLFPDTCQLCTKEEYAPYVREALGIRRGGNLSASSMEVLAVIAYNQPVTRATVDTIRGVDSSYAVSSLLDKDLIEAVGRLEAPGRPMLYGTTDKFLRVFGLADLSELPRAPSLEPADPSALAERDGGTPDPAPADDDDGTPPRGSDPAPFPDGGRPEDVPDVPLADAAPDRGGEPSGTL